MAPTRARLKFLLKPAPSGLPISFYLSQSSPPSFLPPLLCTLLTKLAFLPRAVWAPFTPESFSRQPCLQHLTDRSGQMPVREGAGVQEGGGGGRSELALPPRVPTGLPSPEQVWSLNIWWCHVGAFPYLSPPSPPQAPSPPRPSPSSPSSFAWPVSSFSMRTARPACTKGGRVSQWGGGD